MAGKAASYIRGVEEGAEIFGWAACHRTTAPPPQSGGPAKNAISRMPEGAHSIRNFDLGQDCQQFAKPLDGRDQHDEHYVRGTLCNPKACNRRPKNNISEVLTSHQAFLLCASNRVLKLRR